MSMSTPSSSAAERSGAGLNDGPPVKRRTSLLHATSRAATIGRSPFFLAWFKSAPFGVTVTMAWMGTECGPIHAAQYRCEWRAAPGSHGHLHLC